MHSLDFQRMVRHFYSQTLAPSVLLIKLDSGSNICLPMAPKKRLRTTQGRFPY